jgi:hypothetical protein
MDQAAAGLSETAAGTYTTVTALVPYLLAIGLAPFGGALLLFVATHLEASLPRDEQPALLRRS